MFRQAFAKRRALVPAGVFYEWRETRVAKQPFAVARSDGEPLAFAAVPARARKTGPTYVYQCPVCGKKFRHSKRNPHLGSHKAPGGWQCSGRTGYFVETKY